MQILIILLKDSLLSMISQYILTESVSRLDFVILRWNLLENDAQKLRAWDHASTLKAEFEIVCRGSNLRSEAHLPSQSRAFKLVLKQLKVANSRNYCKSEFKLKFSFKKTRIHLKLILDLFINIRILRKVLVISVLVQFQIIRFCYHLKARKLVCPRFEPEFVWVRFLSWWALSLSFKL
jgi:hypothetical protein